MFNAHLFSSATFATIARGKSFHHAKKVTVNGAGIPSGEPATCPP
jgi:hypothetical protein